MTWRAFKRPRARLDLLEHFVYIGEHNPKAAMRFLAAAENAFERLAEMPGSGPVRSVENERLVGLRSWPIPGFRTYRIFYLPTPSGIDIVRVLHAARDVRSILEDE